MSEAYLEPLQTSKMKKLFAKIVNGFKPLTVFAKSSILDVCNGSKYASGYNYLQNSYKYAMKGVRIFAVKILEK